MWGKYGPPPAGTFRARPAAHEPEVRGGRHAGDYARGARVNAGAARLSRVPRYSFGAEQLRHRRHFHAAGRHDKPRSAHAEGGRRSIVRSMVIAMRTSNVREAAGIHGLASGGMSPREAGKRSL